MLQGWFFGILGIFGNVRDSQVARKEALGRSKTNIKTVDENS
jgi:hypothetical protein